MNILTNFEYIINTRRVKKTPEQIVQEFRDFCRNQNGCIGCPFVEYCTKFTIQQMDKWLVQEYDKSEWINTDDLK